MNISESSEERVPRRAEIEGGDCRRLETPPSMPRGDGVPQRAPRGVLACMPAGDGKPALAQRARGTVMGVNIDDQRGPCLRARFAPHDVEH